jgi:hypothetical protein
MKFKNFFNQHIINELSDYNFDRIPTNVKNLLNRKLLPFNHLFGDKLRIVERMNKVSDYQEKIKKHMVDDFELDFEKWVGFKLTDADKKNPFRIGKLLNKRKQDLQRFIKEYGTVQGEASVQNWQNAINEIDELLKVSDLQKLYKDSRQSDYCIVYSRSPVDVARMSDHTWTSCHSQGEDHFHCALADASLNAGVAYLINYSDFSQIELHLQEDEIFKDKQRSINGIVPVARFRIRCVIDKKGNTLAVPSLKLYGKNAGELGPDFSNQVIAWAKTQDILDFDFERTLTLQGGSYEDIGYDIASMVKKIWGKDIVYETDDSEIEFRDQDEEDDEHAQEQWLIEQRDNYNPEDIYEEAFGTEYEDLFDVEYDINAGSIKLAYKIPDGVINTIRGKNGSIDITKSFDLEFPNRKRQDEPFFATISFLDVTLTFDMSEENVDFDSYVEWYGDGDGRFNDSGLTSDVADKLQIMVASFIGQPYSDDDQGTFELRQMMNKKIYEYFNTEYKVLEEEHINDFYDRFIAGQSTGDKRNFGQFEVPTFTYDITKLNNSTWIKDIELPDQVFDILYEVSSDIEERLGLYISSKFKIPTNASNYSIWDSFHSYFSIPGDFKGEKEVKHGNKILKFRSSTPKRLYNLDIWLTQTDAEIILDSGGLPNLYNALLYLDEEFASEVDKKNLGFFELNDFLKPLAHSKEYNDLANQGQMELDLSHTDMLSINKNMSHFDDAIEQILQESRKLSVFSELNMAKGGMSNQSGSQTQPVPQGNGGQQPPSNNPNPAAVQPQSGGAAPANAQPNATATTPTGQPNQQAQGQGANPDETMEFNNLLKTQQQNPDAFNRQAKILANDPQKFSRFIAHLSQPMS